MTFVVGEEAGYFRKTKTNKLSIISRTNSKAGLAIHCSLIANLKGIAGHWCNAWVRHMGVSYPQNDGVPFALKLRTKSIKQDTLLRNCKGLPTKLVMDRL